jgi:lysophospholipase L1-like esterase
VKLRNVLLSSVLGLGSLVIQTPAFAGGAGAAVTPTPAPPQSQVAHLQAGDFLAVCGDSITEQKLYCRFIEEYLLMCKPQANLRTMQLGWNGETSWGFFSKMPNEALRFSPSAVTICFGMNDGGYAQVVPNYERYRTNLHGIVQAFKKKGVRFIVLGSPGVVDTQTFWGGTDLAAKYNPILANERDIARQVAAEEGVTFANIHDPMRDVMVKAKAKYGPQYALAGAEDGVHPDENGHLVMAYAFLKALGCDGNIGTVNVDLAKGAATASLGHTVLGYRNGEVDLESDRYPFCFYGDAASPKSPKGILEFLPFNEDLNRFRLVVSGTGGRSVRVTWGNASKQFPAAAAERGINLAAEFLDNPFSAQFLKVEEAVKAQQNYETPLVKRLLHELVELETIVPEEHRAVEQLKTTGMRKAKELFDKAAAEVQPVRHSIRVELVK